MGIFLRRAPDPEACRFRLYRFTNVIQLRNGQDDDNPPVPLRNLRGALMSARDNVTGTYDRAALDRLGWPIAWSGTVAPDERRAQEADLAALVREAREWLDATEADTVEIARGEIVSEDLLCNDPACEDCGAQPRALTCEDCGARAVATDCGHQSQPRPIAADERGRAVCEACYAASVRAAAAERRAALDELAALAHEAAHTRE